MAPSEIQEQAAKPMRYFSHDSDAATDIKCRRLIRRCGMEGYGRWWRLCELLASSHGHVLRVDVREDAEILADELGFTDVDDLMRFVVTLSDVGLLVMPGDGTIYSERMNTNAQFFGKNRVNGSKGGRKRKATVA